MKKPVILVDCDGPLSCFTEAYLRAVFLETDQRIPIEDVDQWDIHKTDAFQRAAMAASITPNELKSRVVQHVIKEGFCQTLAVQPGALEAIAELWKHGDVYVVTSPWDSSPTWMYERLWWVHNKLGIPRGHVIQTGRKHLVRGDVFVDDKLSHVEEWGEAWPGATPILFDMHHNRGTKSRYRGGWAEAIRAAAALNGGVADGDR